MNNVLIYLFCFYVYLLKVSIWHWLWNARSNVRQHFNSVFGFNGFPKTSTCTFDGQKATRTDSNTDSNTNTQQQRQTITQTDNNTDRQTTDKASYDYRMNIKAKHQINVALTTPFRRSEPSPTFLASRVLGYRQRFQSKTQGTGLIPRSFLWHCSAVNLVNKHLYM